MMADSDQESTSNTDDLMISGIQRFEEISPLRSPSLASPHTPDAKLTRTKAIMNEDRDSGQGSSTDLPSGTCFDKSHLSTVKSKCDSPRSRSLSPQSRVRVHYTDSAREALDLANKSYERLVEESDERHHLTILLNKRDAERAEFARAEQERQEQQRAAEKEKDKLAVRPLHVNTTPSVGGVAERPARPITVIQEHIKFAEGILASPSTSESGRRSRSLSPIPPHMTMSPHHHPAHLGNRPRSTSPLARGLGHTAASSSRKKLTFEGDGRRSASPLLSRSGREKTAHEIRTKVTNDYIDATSHGLYHPSHRLTADRMAAVSSSGLHSGHSVSSAGKSTDTHRPQQFTDVYVTPDKGKQPPTARYGPLSSTPQRHGHREPVRELSPSRLYVTGQHHPPLYAAEHHPTGTSAATPSTYIKGLQSVRSGLRKLMSEEVDAAQELMVDTSHRAEHVSLRIESTINAENQLLRDQLTRERNLRKQIEADKHEIQAQLLESKDRLHHLTATLKQKDGMMKKLDQNLDEVVNGWQKYEEETKQRVGSLSQNIHRLERESEEQRKYTDRLQADRDNAAEELRREKNTSKDFARESNEQYTRYQEELTEVKNRLEAELDKSVRLEIEVAQATKGRVCVEKQLAGLHEILDQERDAFKEREQELLNKINEITSVQIAVLEQEATRTKAQAEKIEELDGKARKYEQEAETQRHLVSSKSKEVERLQSLLELMDAKHENSLRQLESKLRIELELRVSQAKDDGLRRMADNEINLQQAHQRQLADVVSEHNRQLGAMRERFTNELNRVKGHFEDQVKSAETALEDTKHELEDTLSQKETAETQRDDLTSRLQAVLSLLGGATGTQTSAQSTTKSSSHYNRPPSGSSSHLLRTVNDMHGPLHQQAPAYVDTFTSSKAFGTPDSDLSPAPPSRPPAPQMDSDSPAFKSEDLNVAEDLNVVSNTDTSCDDGHTSPTADTKPGESTGYEMSDDTQQYQQQPQYQHQYQQQPQYQQQQPQYQHQQPQYQQQQPQYQHQYEQERERCKQDSDKPERKVDDEKDEDDSVISVTETYDLGENDSHYRHRRQAELQDYIKKLLNRSVGDPLIETRIDLDESHISVISGLQEHSVILHDANHLAKKAFHQEVIGHTPPVKGSSKKVNPKEIASLISKYGSETKTPSTSEYLEYLKSVAVNNHTGFLKEFANSSPNRRAATAAAKRDLTDNFNTSSSSSHITAHKRPVSNSRVKHSSPEKPALSRQTDRQAKEKTKVKRHSSTRSQTVWK